MNSEYYDILEIKRDSNQESIKKAYRKMAMKNHPDKGGDEQTFKSINEAYSVLSDPEKKNVYDRFGKDGLEQRGGGGVDPNDIFNSMFAGQGHPFFGRQQPKKNNRSQDVKNNIQVQLNDIFKGVTKHITIERTVLDESKVIKCKQCDGQGMVTQRIQMGPMISQTTQPCGNCRGGGVFINKSHVKQSKENITLTIPPGCPENHEIRIHGKTNMEPGKTPGDLIFTVKYMKHNVFSVHSNGIDLQCYISINLNEALNGFKYSLQHLDDSFIEFEHTDILSPNTTMSIIGEGLQGGNLHVKFDIIFPKSLSSPSGTLEEILGQQIRTVNSNSRKVHIKPYTETKKNKQKQHRKQQQQPGDVECNQQ